MPIEIKELVIRASVREPDAERGSTLRVADQKVIVQKAVEQVLEILKQKKER